MNKKTIYKTNILFQRSSFLKGMGSVLNVSGNYFDFDYSESALLADAKAIKSDWCMVGQDLKNSAEKLLHKTN